MVSDLWVFVNEQIMLLQIFPTLMYRYDKTFWAGEFSHPKPQRYTRSNENLTVSDVSQMVSFSLWWIFICSAGLFCFFIISNSQLGFIVCEGLFFFGRWRLCFGVCAETSNTLQLFYFPHTVEFISIFIICSFIWRVLWGLYDVISWSVPALMLCCLQLCRSFVWAKVD